MSQLVLSLFPGADLLGLAFELEGFTVVQGPDVIFGRDIRNFHVPPGRFDGVIGGPPCQPFSRLVHVVRANGYGPRHENLIPEFERCVREAAPAWFVMEEVPAAPLPVVAGYRTQSFMFNNRWLGEEQERTRMLSFGTAYGPVEIRMEVAALEAIEWSRAVTADSRQVPVKMLKGGRPKGGGTMSLAFPEMCRLQGLPGDYLDEAPFTMSGKKRLLGNGVPLPMGRAVARAVKRALAL